MHTIKLCSVLFGAVVHAGCDKQDSLLGDGLRGKWTSTLSAMYYFMVNRRSCWLLFTSHQSESQTLVENRDFCLLHLHSTPPLGGPRWNTAATFGMEKLEWCGYTTVKNSEDTFTSFNRTNRHDGCNTKPAISRVVFTIDGNVPHGFTHQTEMYLKTTASWLK